MGVVMSLILPALAAGAQAAATGIATDEIKHIYDELKILIKQKWIGKPSAEKLLSEYEKDRESWEQILTEKLEQSSIAKDNNILQKAEQLLQKINVPISVDQSRQASAGDVAVTGSNISKDTISAGQSIYKNVRDISQSTTHNRQTRLAVLLWLLTLALTGVIGFGVYLFMTGRLQLPGKSTTSGQFPNNENLGELPNNEKPPAIPEQRVMMEVLDSIQARMTPEEIQEKLGIRLKLYSEVSYTDIFGTRIAAWDGAAIYSFTIEDGSPFYLTFLRYHNSNKLVLVAKSATPIHLLSIGD